MSLLPINSKQTNFTTTSVSLRRIYFVNMNIIAYYFNANVTLISRIIEDDVYIDEILSYSVGCKLQYLVNS